MPRQSKYNKEEKDNVKSYQYKAAIYIRLSVEDGDKEESNSITNQRMLLNQFLKDKIDNIIQNHEYILKTTGIEEICNVEKLKKAN